MRELENDSPHPKPDQLSAVPEDTSDISSYLDFLSEYLYTFPGGINK
jgi:hypothetical protein